MGNEPEAVDLEREPGREYTIRSTLSLRFEWDRPERINTAHLGSFAMTREIWFGNLTLLNGLFRLRLPKATAGSTAQAPNPAPPRTFQEETEVEGSVPFFNIAPCVC